MEFNCYLVLAYIGVIFIGWLIVGAVLKLMRETTEKEYEERDGKKEEDAADSAADNAAKKSWRRIDLWVGGTERFIAMTLVICAPSHLATFIGGWTALKYASNWKRLTGNEYHGGKGFAFMVGTAVSFGLAILVGLCFNPDAIDVWAKPDQ